MSDIELMNQIDAYLRGELSPQERADFENLRSQNPELDHRVVEHQNFLNQLTGYGKQRQLKADMDSIHEQLDIESLKEAALPVSSRVYILWKKYRSNVAIAASVGLFAVLSTLISTGYFNKTVSSNFSALRRELNSIKRSQNELKKDMLMPSKGPVNPGHFGGTGFALSSNG
ncbi:MAG TPA: serine protease, partial [Daejeonella sp.]|nr:serine protease [Daejeonella sp.]